jgi:hypothetical protein
MGGVLSSKNTLAYYDIPSVTALNNFISQTPHLDEVSSKS